MLTLKRTCFALFVGALGCLFTWVVTPYNNFYLNNSYISDSYFPVISVTVLLALLLVANPILKLARPAWVFNRRQLALVFAVLLAGAILPSQGLLRMLPWSIARTNQQINQSTPLGKAFANTGVPHALFPDKIGDMAETPVSDQFLDELRPGQSIPWEPWIGLLPYWGVFLLSCWLLMIGIGLVLYPQWREKERLPFPLLEVYRSLLPEADSGKVLPALFRDRVFWTGAGMVMFLYLLSGLNFHTGGRVPSIPLGWQLASVFSDVPWRYLPRPITNVYHVYFMLVGMAFFMPNRVSLSIWFFTLAYGLYEMFGRAYVPAYNDGAVHDHRNGAMISITLLVLYLSRHHLRTVARLMVSRTISDPDRLLKMSGWMTVAGAAGMFIWLLWTGVTAPLAALFVLIGFMTSLIVARVVAETGLPFIRIVGLHPVYFMAMLPARWLSGAAVYMAGFIDMIFPLGSRVSPAVMVAHAAAVDEKASARHQIRVGYMLIAVMLVSLVVCGAVHLYLGYHHAYTIDGKYQQLNIFGATRMNESQTNLLRWSNGTWPMPADRLGNFSFGIGLAGFLQLMCMMFPSWPLHPVGIITAGNFYGDTGWASILIGWAIKVVLIQFGGAAAFRRAKPFFLGIIMGEIFSAIIWTLVPVVLLWTGTNPDTVGHIYILPM